MSTKQIHSMQEFEAKIIEGSQTRPVLVDFFATWCGPCKMMAPALEQFAQEHAAEVDVYKVDVDECSEAAVQYRVMSVPTLALFQNGELARQAIGAQTKAGLEAFVL